jgi:hypothetical protein
MVMAGWPVATLRAASHALDLQVAATPTSRDRTVDLMRALSITVVVLWHWTGSVTHRRDGVIVMPNPIDQVPLLWLATWLARPPDRVAPCGGGAPHRADRRPAT